MKPKACRNGSQAQLGGMRFTEFVEKSHSLSLVKGKKIQLTLEIKHDTQGVGAAPPSFGLWLYILLFFRRHEILSRNKAFWEIYGSAFSVPQFWRIMYHVEMTAAYFVYLEDSWCVITVFRVCLDKGGKVKWWLKVAFQSVKKTSRRRLYSFLGLGIFSLLNLLKALFLQEAFLDWLHSSLHTPAGFHISFWSLIHQVFMKA